MWLKRINYRLKYYLRNTTFSLVVFTGFMLLAIPLSEYLFSWCAVRSNKSRIEALKQNDLINYRHKICSRQNIFLFNDKNYSVEKTPGVFRIIVLGDSFIWGDGLEKKDIWSRKLEEKLKKNYNIEVLHWGKMGWSIVNHLNFLKDNFISSESIYDADLIIFGVVENDLEVDGKVRHEKADIAGYLKIRFLERIFPYIFKKINKIFTSTFSDFFQTNIGHNSYLIRLVAGDNIKKYQQKAEEIKIFLDKKQIPFFFVITPYASKKYIPFTQKIQDCLVKKGIYCLNFTKDLVETFKGINYKKQYASTVNYHPGPLLTEQYASYTYNELVRNGWIQKAEKK